MALQVRRYGRQRGQTPARAAHSVVGHADEAVQNFDPVEIPLLSIRPFGHVTSELIESNRDTRFRQLVQD